MPGLHSDLYKAYPSYSGHCVFPWIQRENSESWKEHSCHRTTISHFLNRGKWDEGRQDSCYGHQAVSVTLPCNGIVLNYAIVMYDKSRSKIKIVQDTGHRRETACSTDIVLFPVRQLVYVPKAHGCISLERLLYDKGNPDGPGHISLWHPAENQWICSPYQ